MDQLCPAGAEWLCGHSRVTGPVLGRVYAWSEAKLTNLAKLPFSQTQAPISQPCFPHLLSKAVPISEALWVCSAAMGTVGSWCCLFAEGFHGWGSWNQLLPEVSTPPVCAEPLSSCCHLLCTGIPLLLSPHWQSHQALTHTSSLLCRVLKDQERTAGERTSPKIPEGGFFPFGFVVLFLCIACGLERSNSTSGLCSFPAPAALPWTVCAVHEAGRGAAWFYCFILTCPFVNMFLELFCTDSHLSEDCGYFYTSASALCIFLHALYCVLLLSWWMLRCFVSSSVDTTLAL